MDNETYSVEPVDETLPGRHRVYRESDSVSSEPTLSCGMYYGSSCHRPTFIMPLFLLLSFDSRAGVEKPRFF